MAASSVYLVCTGSGQLWRIDGTGRAKPVRHGLVDPLAVAVVGHEAWIANNDGGLLRVSL